MTNPTHHTEIISNWVDHLKQLDYVLAVWLEGSLSFDRGHLSSDIDIRIVIEDAYRFEDVLPNIGERISVNESGFIRAITPDGIVIDLDIYDPITARGMRVEHYKMLFSKAGDFPLEDHSLHHVLGSPYISFPYSQLSPQNLSQMMIDFTVVMAALPSMFYINEYHSAALQADLSRIDLVKVMYHVVGIRYAKLYKHLSEVMPERILLDLRSTYGDYETPKAIARTLITIFDLIGKYMQELGDKIGGGFDPSWYWRIYGNIVSQLIDF